MFCYDQATNLLLFMALMDKSLFCMPISSVALM
jgi:hypothetical protein